MYPKFPTSLVTILYCIEYIYIYIYKSVAILAQLFMEASTRSMDDANEKEVISFHYCVWTGSGELSSENLRELSHTLCTKVELGPARTSRKDFYPKGARELSFVGPLSLQTACVKRAKEMLMENVSNPEFMAKARSVEARQADREAEQAKAKGGGKQRQAKASKGRGSAVPPPARNPSHSWTYDGSQCWQQPLHMWWPWPAAGSQSSCQQPLHMWSDANSESSCPAAGSQSSWQQYRPQQSFEPAASSQSSHQQLPGFQQFEDAGLHAAAEAGRKQVPPVPEMPPPGTWWLGRPQMPVTAPPCHLPEMPPPSLCRNAKRWWLGSDEPMVQKGFEVHVPMQPPPSKYPRPKAGVASSRRDRQLSAILGENEITGMRRIRGLRCSDYFLLCDAWSKKIAKRFPSSKKIAREGMKTPSECSDSVVSLFREMQVHGLVAGISKFTERGNIVCHFHISNAPMHSGNTVAFHGTPLANMPTVMEDGIQALVDKCRPELGPIIFCFPDRGPDRGYGGAFTYSPWTWIKRLNMFLRVVLRIHCNHFVGTIGRGKADLKQYYTKEARVVGANVELCLADGMAYGEWFFGRSSGMQA